MIISYLTVFGTSEVDEFDCSFRVHHYIGTFDVPVDNAVTMEIVECRGNLSCVMNNGVKAE